MSTILIKNGTLIDGSGSKRYLADILIENEKIKKIGKLDLTADKVIDASGKIVSPGFIDTHSHSDLKVLIEPFVEPKIRQGITTEILGQDGISMAPLPEEYVSSWRKNLSGLATGASWLCYYKALQLGEASKVVPIDKLSIVITIVLAFIFLGEQITLKTLIGCCLIVIGTFIMIL